MRSTFQPAADEQASLLQKYGIARSVSRVSIEQYQQSQHYCDQTVLILWLDADSVSVLIEEESQFQGIEGNPNCPVVRLVFSPKEHCFVRLHLSRNKSSRRLSEAFLGLVCTVDAVATSPAKSVQWSVVRSFWLNQLAVDRPRRRRHLLFL